MYFYIHQAIRALILLGFAGFLFKLHYFEEIAHYINPKYIAFSQVASILFLFLFFIQVPRIWSNKKGEDLHENCGPWGCNHDDGFSNRVTVRSGMIYGIIFLPVVTGILLPANALDASIAVNRGALMQQQSLSDETHHDDHEGHFHLHSDHVSEEICLPIEKAEAELLESGNRNEVIVMERTDFAKKYFAITENVEMVVGREIIVEGFGLKEESLSPNQLFIGRFLITHCVADATVVGFLAETEKEIRFPEGSWVAIRGILDMSRHGHEVVPIIRVKQLDIIEKPMEPYIYP
ncbi:TIGR03943 family putative permease subunit [Alkalihalobacterium elongatum]|uniref:TIGR03943 family putative permease subunit n=1 Tax=Alkalihalobacterium elongatum TaxID=2675466 RepID=UPI001C1F7C1D|nr:TIGR03943 family protein [Alkalihalobacterium elongatum]